ncbi:MAG: hypothetical protein AB1705_04150 [Verrucomicrobiota bacterium]
MKTKWMKRIVLGLPLLAATLLGGGCVVHDDGYGYPHVHGPAVHIEAGHVHTAHCGHYHYRGRWHHAHGHVHGPGCGHVVRGGIWVVVR